MRATRRRWIETVLLLAFLVALGNWLYTRQTQRQTAAEATDIAALLEVGPQSRVADVGAGNGRFTIPLAQRLTPDGYLYATEIDLGKLASIERDAARAGLDNITLLEARADDTGLPPNCCDAILLRTVYHHLTAPAAVGADLFRALRPGGRLLVIDFAPSRLLSLFSRVDGVPENRGGHGIDPEIVVDELTDIGFLLEGRFDPWQAGNYALVFTRPR